MSANSDKLVVKNRILSALPAEEYKRLLGELKRKATIEIARYGQ